MKNIFILLLLTWLVACTPSQKEDQTAQANHHPKATARNYADSVNSGIIPIDTLKGSPVRIAMDYVGGNHVHITYGSPGVRGRIIWGGLVAFDEVWVTGSHNATSIEFSKNVMIDGKLVSAGKYAFFTIPGTEEWILILNKNYNQHLADDYSAAEDLLRVTVKPTVLSNVVQRLTYSVVKQSENEGSIVLQWDKVQVSLSFKNAN
jgi:hypothetical protein